LSAPEKPCRQLLPRPGALDMSGVTGVRAAWLAEAGYSAHVMDFSKALRGGYSRVWTEGGDHERRRRLPAAGVRQESTPRRSPFLTSAVPAITSTLSGGIHKPGTICATSARRARSSWRQHRTDAHGLWKHSIKSRSRSSSPGPGSSISRALPWAHTALLTPRPLRFDHAEPILRMRVLIGSDIGTRSL
jgi:hypothetical protein